jgi:hypothetical protein
MPDPDHDWAGADGGDQWASSHGDCTLMERQSATGCGSCTRYHVRLNQTKHQDLNGRYETVGTPHYEEQTFCGHAVPPDRGSGSGFDLGRGHLKNDWIYAYGSGKLWNVQNWGNTLPMLQCNDWAAASSGRVYWLETDADPGT